MRIPVFSDYDVRFQILFFGRLFASMGWAISMPFLAIYMTQPHPQGLGVDPLIVGIAYTTAAIFGALSQIVAGEFADKIGRRSTMIASMGIRVITFVLMAAAVNFNSGFLSLAVLMIFSSITGNTFYPAANAMIIDIVPVNKRVEGFGLSRIGVNIGWAAGPLLGGFSSQFISYSFTFLLTAIFAAVTLIMIIAFVTETCPSSAVEKFNIREVLRIRKDRAFMLYSLFTILAGVIAAQMVSTLSIYSQRYTSISEADLGGLFALNGILVVFLQFPVSRALSKYRLTTLLSTGTILYCFGYLSVAFMTTIGPLLIAMTVITLGEIVSSPPAMALVSNMAPSNKRGQYMGVYGLFDSLGGSFGPTIGLMSLSLFPAQPILIWLVPGLFGFVAAAGYLLLGRRLTKEINTCEF